MSHGINLGTQSLISSMQSSIQHDLPIIDVRSANSFAELHLQNSANIPFDELAERTHELPEKNTPLNVVGQTQQLTSATEFLQSKGYQICASQVVSIEGLNNTFSTSKLTTGNQSTRFWQPASVVQTFCDKVAVGKSNKKGLDLACGAGRDSIFLGLQGWQMTAVDSSEHALSRVTGSAKRAGIKVDCIQLDLEKNIQWLLENKQTFDLVVIVRYLHRPLFEMIDRLLSKSGYLVYQTFMQGCEQFGSPRNPRFLLKEKELSDYFSNYQIIYDQIEHLNDGRPVNSFIAQK
jgi:tellurite methyltransferase